MPSTVESSQGGAGFTFSGFTGSITAIEVSATAPQTDVSHLGLTSGTKKLFKKAPLSDSPEVKIEFIGGGLPPVGTKAVFTLTGDFGSTKAGDCTQAICTQASIKAAVGDLLKGSATFKLSST